MRNLSKVENLFPTFAPRVDGSAQKTAKIDAGN